VKPAKVVPRYVPCFALAGIVFLPCVSTDFSELVDGGPWPRNRHSLEGSRPDLLVAYAYRLIDPGQENLPVADSASRSRRDDGIHDVVH